MEKNKVTRREMFVRISDFIASVESEEEGFQQRQEEMIDFINHQIKMLDDRKKNSATGEKKLSKEQEQNLVFSEHIWEQMEAERSYSTADLMKELPVVEEFLETTGKEMSTQKMSSLMKPLVDDGRVIKTTDKRKVSYKKS